MRTESTPAQHPHSWRPVHGFRLYAHMPVSHVCVGVCVSRTDMVSHAHAARSRALTADTITMVIPEPSRYGIVYRRRSQQLSARGDGSVGGTGGMVSGVGVAGAAGDGSRAKPLRRGFRRLQGTVRGA